ncbi:MAG: phosphatidylglycerophosphatase A [Firmicutes bacterium]|nr:phosphatidylglycerophosphatase A [Bacillota bacterium]
MTAPRWAWWIATGFGSGRLKPAPGTWGSLAALVAWLMVVALGPLRVFSWAMLHRDHSVAIGVGYWSMEALFLALPLLATWVGIRASNHVLRETGAKDPSYIVIDEWAGLWIALWPVRWVVTLNLFRMLGHPTWESTALLAVPFALFRLFDIWKPWPIRQIQSLPEGEGVMADDVVAGLYALVLTQALLPLLTP